jgi:hypothetical protein
METIVLFLEKVSFNKIYELSIDINTATEDSEEQEKFRL